MALKTDVILSGVTSEFAFAEKRNSICLVEFSFEIRDSNDFNIVFAFSIIIEPFMASLDKLVSNFITPINPRIKINSSRIRSVSSTKSLIVT